MWTSVYKFEGLYEINLAGQVKSLRSNTILTQRYSPDGYLVVSLRDKNGKQTTKGVHRLLLESFSPVKDMDSLTVNHINHIKDDNRLENLEWLTNADNVKEAFSAGLHKGKHECPHCNDRPVVCIETGVEYTSSAAAVQALGLASRGKVGDACKDKNKTCGGFHWRYKDEAEITVEEILKTQDRAIRCVETGEIFPTATAAGASIGVSRKAIARACKSPSFMSGGKHWEYVKPRN